MIQILLLSCLSLFSINLASADTLKVGMAITDITPAVKDNIPLGGYGDIRRRKLRLFAKKPVFRMFRVAKGHLDPIRAKAMFIKRPDKKLLFISLDVVGVTKEMHRDLIKRLANEGFTSEEVFVSGTHTHSGPGSLSANPLWEIIAMDRYQKKYYERFMGQVVDTVRLAIANVQDAELHTLSFDTQGLQNNRRGENRPLDPNANLLVARSMNGEWLGGIVNFAVHGTSLDSDNLFFSSDVPGAIERELENLMTSFNGYVRLQSNPNFLFIQSAEGDVAPKLGHIELGLEFAKQAESHWSSLAPLAPEWELIQKEIPMGKPKLDLAKCVDAKWLPKHMNIGLKKFVSSTTILTQLHFGNIWLMTWPGEPTTELGMMLSAQAREAGAEKVWVLGLTNDHLAYFVTPEEFKTGGYEACTNFFGPTGGTKIIEAHKNLSNKFQGTL